MKQVKTKLIDLVKNNLTIFGPLRLTYNQSPSHQLMMLSLYPDSLQQRPFAGPLPAAMPVPSRLASERPSLRWNTALCRACYAGPLPANRHTASISS